MWSILGMVCAAVGVIANFASYIADKKEMHNDILKTVDEIMKKKEL